MKFKPQHYSQFIIFLFFSKLGSQYHIKHITKKNKKRNKMKLNKNSSPLEVVIQA